MLAEADERQVPLIDVLVRQDAAEAMLDGRLCAGTGDQPAQAGPEHESTKANGSAGCQSYHLLQLVQL